MNHLVTITKSDGTTQLFEEEKLVNSLKRVGTPDQTIDKIVEEVEHRMHNGMSTNEIYAQAFDLLKRQSVTTAVKYSIRRALLELGPDGFPFEKFIARIFRTWGYETLTDQSVMGACVAHEIDVVAWKDYNLAMVEAKFHNEFGMKSDVKVALYVKARFDDIANTSFAYNGMTQKLTERWLVTNTKFTDRAIAYGTCVGLKMIGWNYPNQNNLHHIIEQNGLHPITCMNTITNQQKRDLLGRNIVACIDVVNHQEVLKEIGVHNEDLAKIVEEARIIIDRAK